MLYLEGFFKIIILSVLTTSLTIAETMPSKIILEAAKQADLEVLRPLSEDGLSPEEFQYRDGILLKLAMSLPKTINEQTKSDPAYAASWMRHQPKAVKYITFAGENGHKRGKPWWTSWLLNLAVFGWTMWG